MCLSDTHGLQDRMVHAIPEGDVLLHAGDFSNVGSVSDLTKFNEWMGELPHKHKIVVFGNHEVSLDPDKAVHPSDPQIFESFLSNVTILNQSEIIIDGIKIWGEPRQPEFNGWAFNVPRQEMHIRCWSKVPEDVHILLTHGPPSMYGDFVHEVNHHGREYKRRCGCVHQKHLIEQSLPNLKAVVCGHIHDGYGVYKIQGKDAYVYNCAICDEDYRPLNKPLVFDLDLSLDVSGENE